MPQKSIPGPSLLFPFFFLLASMLNYLDRTSISTLSAQIRSEMGLNNLDFSWVINAFLIAYAISYPLGGWLADRMGSKKTLILSIFGWSLINSVHALAQSWEQLIILRSLLGLSEACFYPAAIKFVADNFPPLLRSKIISLLVLGMGIGITLTPPLTVFLASSYSWRGVFFTTGVLGIFIGFTGLKILGYPRTPLNPGLSFDFTENSEKENHQVPDRGNPRLIYSSAWFWVLLIARGLGDAVWYFYIFWLPTYLIQVRGFDFIKIGLTGWIPFLAANFGAWAGGWGSSLLIARKWPILKSRKFVLAVSAALLPCGILAALSNQIVLVLGFFSLTLFGIMAYGTVVMTIPADLFPANRLGLVAGFCGASGCLAGACFQTFTGWMVDHHGFWPVFLIAGLMHPLSALLIGFGIRIKTAHLKPETPIAI
jgi:MFS transporter, ACS family, hexuronate transporter